MTALFALQSPTNKSISTAMLKQVLSRRRWQVRQQDVKFKNNFNILLGK